MADMMQQRRDTAANWATANPVLGAGQIGYEIVAGRPWKAKVGDGVTAWNSLPYQQYLPNGGTTGQALVKKSNNDNDVQWSAVQSLPPGGTFGMALIKNSEADFDVAWMSIWRTATFTSSGSFVIPAKTLAVTLCGGGGGGTSIWGMGGGGAQAYWQYILTNMTIGETVSVVVGAGGVAGLGPINGSLPSYSSAWSGGDGGNSSFGSYLVAAGGKGAKSTSTTANPGLPGGIGGQRGGMPSLSAAGTTLRIGGQGGGCLLGIGGQGGCYATSSVGTARSGENGIGYGSGGGGGSDDQPGGGTYRSTAAGNGAPGIVIIEW